MDGNKPHEHVFFFGQERPDGKPLIFTGSDSVLVFEAGEDALHYFKQSEDAPPDTVVAYSSMRGVLEFAGDYGLIVELVAPGDDYPTIFIRPRSGSTFKGVGLSGEQQEWHQEGSRLHLTDHGSER